MNDEKTIYDNEKAQYQSQDDEATQYDAYERENDQLEETASSETEKTEKVKNHSEWHNVAAGAGVGVMLGAAATLLTSGKPAEHKEEGDTHPDWTDGEVPVATSVNDDMSFSEAFNAARTEVGPGGVFEWHGYIYSTYTEDEWGSMTAEQRDEYGSHFNWHGDAPHDTASSGSSHSSGATHGTHASDEVDVVSAENHNEQSTHHQESTGNDVEVAGVTPAVNTEEVDDPEVEILGVVHDGDSGVNIGGLMVDGQEVVVIDIDNDEVFDVMGTDQNGDQQLSQNEFVDISGQHLTVNDLGGFSNPDGSSFASNNDDIDYTNDSSTYEG